MGISIAYRGRLADLTRIEDFEDRLLDFALEVGGLAQVWRSQADSDPQRVVRGAILELAPGQEPAPFETREERHPLLSAAMDLLKHLHTVFRDADARFEPSLRTLFQGAGDAMGGLAQALSRHGEEDDPDEHGLRITQLKRALRGAAFTLGALFPLRPAVTAEQFTELQHTLRQVEQDIFHEMGRLRSEPRPDDS